MYHKNKGYTMLMVSNKKDVISTCAYSINLNGWSEVTQLKIRTESGWFELSNVEKIDIKSIRLKSNCKRFNRKIEEFDGNSLIERSDKWQYTKSF